ncbi:MAG: hypothetical protein O3C34_19930 [Proteobacteria bacterium]|nr:hypothetical protein [Pseudomonadota bacterium]
MADSVESFSVHPHSSFPKSISCHVIKKWLEFLPSREYNHSMVEISDVIKLIQRLQQEAFEAGWKAGIDSIFEAASKGRAEPVKSIRLEPAHPMDEFEKPTEATKPAVQIIQDVIKELPGLRGADVFREAVKRIPGSDFKKMDRTGRTALKRLKERRKIHQRDKKWYPGPQPTISPANVMHFGDQRLLVEETEKD